MVYNTISPNEKLLNEINELNNKFRGSYLQLSGGTIKGAIKTNEGAVYPTDGNVYINSPSNSCIGYISNLLGDLNKSVTCFQTYLANNRLKFSWEIDSDNVSKLHIWIDNVLVAKIPQGQGL